MAATFNESQKIDYLWKKVGYGVTKTAEVTSKEAFNESIASPLLYRGDLVWMESSQITSSPPASTNSIIQVYKDGSGSFSPSVECTEDLTAPDNQTWKTNLTNWVPTQFGDNYLIQVYVANSGVTNPQTSGTKLFQAGSGSDDTWFFDYQSGVLNFNGANIPAQITGGITGKSVYIVGYRYVGLLGVTNLPSNTSIGNLNFTSTTISSTTTNGNIIFTPNGNGIVQVSSSLTSNANITANFFIGNGSQLTGVAASNAVTAGTVTASAQPNITSVGNLTSLVVLGNITAGNIDGGNLVIANFFSGNGNLLSNINGSNVVGNVTSAITANFANYAGNVTISSQPNITSVGNLISLDVTGNITANNANLGNLVIANFFTGDGGLLSNVAAGNAVNAGTVTASAQPNITSVGNLTSLVVTGNASVGGLLTDNYYYANGSPVDFQQPAGSNTQIQYNDNDNFGGNTNFTFDSVTGNLLIPGNLNWVDGGGIYNYATGEITLSPNIASDNTGLNLQNNDGAYLYAEAEVVISSNSIGTVNDWTFSTTGNLTAPAIGTIDAGNLLIANFITGTITTNAQPNITSVGTLTELDVLGLSNLGPISNVTITGGISGYYLQTDGSGNLSWASVASGTAIVNGTSNVDISSPDGNITMAVDGNTNIVTVTGIGANVNGILNVTGNIISGNANLGNAAYATYFIGSGANLTNIPAGNISGQVANALVAGTVYTAAQNNITSVGTLTSLDVSGNITAGNANLGYTVTANYYVGNGSLLTGIATATTAAAVANGTSNVNIPFVNGNINLSASGNANVLVVTGTGANITGTANVDGNLIATNIISGGGSGGSITGANLVSANYFTGTLTTNAQPNITSVGTLTSLDVSGHMVANTFQMGYDVYAFYSTSVYFATTASTANNQVLWSYTAADLSAIDFTIIATDATGSTRQTCKISAAILGTTVAFNEYGGLFINGGVGSFSVLYNGSGPTPTLDLVVTPDSSNLTEYNMLISKYLV